jgi:hypothetical protein
MKKLRENYCILGKRPKDSKKGGRYVGKNKKVVEKGKKMEKEESDVHILFTLLFSSSWLLLH